MTDEIYKKQLAAFGIESSLETESEKDKQRRQDQHETRLGVIREVMGTINGREWFYFLLDLCQTFTSPFVPGKPDISSFLAGSQAVGMKIYGDIMSVAPEQYLLMLQEAAAKNPQR